MTQNDRDAASRSGQTDTGGSGSSTGSPGSGLPSEMRANPGYAAAQLARALAASREHEDEGVRARASRRVDDWMRVVSGMLRGALAVGARTPVAGMPAWATLKVVTGGFATGEALAGGPLLDHERALLTRLGVKDEDADVRRVMNSHYLTEAGLAELDAMLAHGTYRLTLPEEGALLGAAWLLKHGHIERARAVLAEIQPFFGRLRFYPAPADRPQPVLGVEATTNVRVQDVGDTVAALAAVRTKPAYLRQRESALVWAPLHDRIVGLLLETVEGDPPRVRIGAGGAPERRQNGALAIEGGWPCQRYPAEWPQRARALLDEYARLRGEHHLCRSPDRENRTFAKLRGYVARCAEDPGSLTGLDVSRIREMLAGSIHKRGVPGSERLLQLRRTQAAQAGRPTPRELGRVLIERLEEKAPDKGIGTAEDVLRPVAEQEEARHGIPAGSTFSESLRRKVLRCLEAPVEVLVEHGVLTSGEAIARVLPQITSHVRAASIPDPELRALYASIYEAFRRRRSLLLLNLNSQVKIEELPWVQAIEAVRTHRDDERGVAREVLSDVVALTLRAFPEAILPNKLLQEIRALADAAGLDIPIVDEVAADIFMGEFSEKFLRAAQRAADLLDGTLYERYYDIPYEYIRRIDDVRESRFGARVSPKFAALCRRRAGEAEEAPERRWSVAHNGKIIEQSQILTTHNLAALVVSLCLRERLAPHFEDMARRSFAWVCQRLQMRKIDPWQAKLRTVKNCAYAWRQMVFYAAMLPRPAQEAFTSWAVQHLAVQPPVFQRRFRPALAGLRGAMGERPPDSTGAASQPRPFLGWTTGEHWLLAES